MRKLKNLKMMLTVAFVIAAGVLFFYDGRKASDVQWETAEETESENESSGMVSGEDTKETESVSTEPEPIYVIFAGMSKSRMSMLWQPVQGFMRPLRRPAVHWRMQICSS